MRATATSSTIACQHLIGKGWVSPLPPLDSDRTLVLAFGASAYMREAAVFRELRSAFPSSHILGCSTSGEILGPQVFDNSLVVAIKQFRHTTLSTAIAPVRTAADSFNAGVVLAQQLLRPGLRGVIVLSDGLCVNGTELLRGCNSILPEGVVLTGGLAGDGDRFKQTWVLHTGSPAAGCVSAVGLYGDRVQIGHGSKGGWSPFGPERTITRSEGNVLLEFDGKPALELYKTYLGERARELPASGLLFPLTIRRSRNDEQSLVRTILGVDESRQSLTFAGDIPQGWSAQLMRANFDWLVDASAQSARASSDQDPSAAEPLTIAVSCIGRRLILGDRTEDELAAARNALPPQSLMAGFYSYGELSPHVRGGRCELHNQTMTITTITER